MWDMSWDAKNFDGELSAGLSERLGLVGWAVVIEG